LRLRIIWHAQQQYCDCDKKQADSSHHSFSF
jgi:hypothetical protein